MGKRILVAACVASTALGFALKGTMQKQAPENFTEREPVNVITEAPKHLEVDREREETGSEKASFDPDEKSPFLRSSHFSAVGYRIARKNNLARALIWLDQAGLAPEERFSAIQGMFRFWGETKPASVAARMADSLPSIDDQTAAFISLSSSLFYKGGHAPGSIAAQTPGAKKRQIARARSRLRGAFIKEDPLGALKWFASHKDDLPENSLRHVIKEVFGTDKILQDDRIFKEALSSLNFSEQIQAIRYAAPKKTLRGTASALEWAEALENPHLQKIALSEIARKSPVGIGASFGARTSGGPLKFENVLAGGPSSLGGVKMGDVITSIQTENTKLENLDGTHSKELQAIIRRSPGKKMTFGIQRPDDSGGFSHMEVTLVPESIFFTEK